MRRLDTAGRKDLKGPRGSPRGFWGLAEGLPPPARPSGLRQPGQDAWQQGNCAPGRPAPRCAVLLRGPFQSGQPSSPPWSGLLGMIPGPLPWGGSRLCFEMTDKVINCKANSKNPSQTRVCLWICLRPRKPTEKGLESSRALQPAPAEGPGGAGAA